MTNNERKNFVFYSPVLRATGLTLFVDENNFFNTNTKVSETPLKIDTSNITDARTLKLLNKIRASYIQQKKEGLVQVSTLQIYETN